MFWCNSHSEVRRFAGLIEILEQRVAPATVLISPDLSTHLANGAELPAKMIYSSSLGNLAVRVNAGDRVFLDLDGSGTKTAGDRLALAVMGGRTVAFFTTMGTDLMFDQENFIDLAIGGRFSGSLPLGLDGNIRATLARDGEFVPDVTFRSSIAGLSVGGAIGGDINVGGSILDFSVSQQQDGPAVGNVFAGNVIRNMSLHGGTGSLLAGAGIAGVKMTNVRTDVVIAAGRENNGGSIRDIRLELAEAVGVQVLGGPDSAITGDGGDVANVRIIAPNGAGRIDIEGGQAGTTDGGVEGTGGDVRDCVLRLGGSLGLVTIFGGNADSADAGSISGVRIVATGVQSFGGIKIEAGTASGERGTGGRVIDVGVSLLGPGGLAIGDSSDVEFTAGQGWIGGSLEDIRFEGSGEGVFVTAGDGVAQAGDIKRVSVASVGPAYLKVKAGDVAGFSDDIFEPDLRVRAEIGDGGNVRDVSVRSERADLVTVEIQAGSGGPNSAQWRGTAGNGGIVRGVDILAVAVGNCWVTVLGGAGGNGFESRDIGGTGGGISIVNMKTDGSAYVTLTGGNVGSGGQGDGGSIDSISVEATVDAWVSCEGGIGGSPLTGNSVGNGGRIRDVGVRSEGSASVGLSGGSPGFLDNGSSGHRGDVDEVRLHSGGAPGSFSFGGRNVRDVNAEVGSTIDGLSVWAARVENFTFRAANVPVDFSVRGVVVNADVIRGLDLDLGSANSEISLMALRMQGVQVVAQFASSVSFIAEQFLREVALSIDEARSGISLVSGYAGAVRSPRIDGVAIALGSGSIGAIDINSGGDIRDVSITRAVSGENGFPSVTIQAGHGDQQDKPARGGSIEGVRIDAPGQAAGGGRISIFAGNGGATFRGGRVSNIRFDAPLVSAQIIAGFGGENVEGGRVGDGGSIREISGLLAALQLRAGAGGEGMNGGSGGTISRVSLAAGDISEIIAGSGGAGFKRAGDGGSVVSISTPGEIDGLSAGEAGPRLDESAVNGIVGVMKHISSANLLVP